LQVHRWLISPRADFWFASAGASAGLLAALAWIVFSGDRELDGLDLILSELHLGATYDAVLRRRLWRHLPGDVLVVPLVILGATAALMNTGHWLVLTSIAMYAAIWHRGRQNFGLARYYQRMEGGPVSRTHSWLFSGAIYAPMIAAALLYGHLAGETHDGDAYLAVETGAAVAWGSGVIALCWITCYVVWAYGRRGLHPGEGWIIVAHAVAFGSAYVLGASNTSFLFVLTVHHEIQYLYFAYAVARRQKGEAKLRSEFGFASSFAVWPIIGLAGAMSSSFIQAAWLAPLGLGGLFCHYWLDGRIWTHRSMGIN
jgi:hypothetical protein